jgi:predicted porin
MKIYLVFIFSLFLGLKMTGQQDTINPNLDLSVYTLFRVHLALFDQDSEIQDGVSRAGFLFSYHFGKNNQFKAFVNGEFGIRLIDNEFSFHADPNTNEDGFTVLQFNDDPNTFSTRLGYMGINFAKYGSIAFGKLNSVYSDIARQADIFNVLSGQSTYVYSPDGSDGGETGTGRAESAIVYRNVIGRFGFGLQTQMRARSNNYFDNYAANLQFKLTDFITLGAAYNRMLLNTQFEQLPNLQGLEGDPVYYSFSVQYIKGPFYLAGVYANQENGDFVNTVDFGTLEPATVVYSGIGYEISSSYLFMDKRLNVLAGFNYKKPETENPNLPKDFRKQFYIAGLQYQFIKYASVYAEYRYEDGVNKIGKVPPNVFLVGLKLDFDKKWSKYVDMRL